MHSRSRWPSLSVPLLLGLPGALLLLPHVSLAQTVDSGGYHTSENSALMDPGTDDGYSVLKSTADSGDLQSQGPVRMARFAYVEGNVTWRDGATGDWSQATVNMPLKQGAEILVLKGGRADVQFDDGSELRLGNGALVTLKTLYSDTKGEFTQISMKEGLATLHSRHSDSVYQVDTPLVSVKSVGPTQIRFGVDGGSEIAVQTGSANIEGAQGKTVVQQGSYVYLASSTSEYQPKPNPAPDTWDQWNADRNQLLAGDAETKTHVPANVGLVAGDLGAYGTWRQDENNGWVWSPNNQPPDWRPYSDGQWNWVDPYGWTWVSNEPWGWAPYHYGTWYDAPWGWSWCPGPYSQYWSPGVVSFSNYGAGIGWAPLCPWEVVYPSFCGLGRWGTNWGLDFSVGWCGRYLPSGRGFCEGRQLGNGSANGFLGGDRLAGLGRVLNGIADHGFVPFNARNANGATSASRDAFGGKGGYQAVNKGSSIFGSGKTIASPRGGGAATGLGSIQSSAAPHAAAGGFASSRPSTSVEGRAAYQGAFSFGGARRAAGLSGPEAAASARASLGYSGGYSGRAESEAPGRAGSQGSSRAAVGFGQSGRSYGTPGFGGAGSFGANAGSARSYGSYGAGSYRAGQSYGGYNSSGGRAGGYATGGNRAFSGGARSFSGGRSFSGRAAVPSGGSRGGGGRSAGARSGGRRR